MTKDALKFFQAYIKEMISLGGENLPKTISSTLGAKLAKLYKDRGISEIKSGLRKCFSVLKGRTKINKSNENVLDFIVRYWRKFCPIGGNYNPEIKDMVQKSICRPYILGFLKELNPNFNYELISKQCILSSKKRTCHFLLRAN
ncbi:MAG: hypothetical protein GF383_07280 [Candidatus Lokiarchaeota archaeon]|nr:hypothetical protein [Candidatus Lokiarchaeota archaeon]MBD3339970.1 hypothetical protein [Candidatus Lokiarchaeota archaeon]